MKKLIISMSAMLLTCGFAEAQGAFTINGNLTNANGEKVYMYYDNGIKDSTVVANGKFSFKGNMPVPYYNVYMLLGDKNDQMNVKTWTLALEPVTMTIDGDANDVTNLVIKGGKTQTELNSLNAEMADAYKMAAEFNTKYYACKSQEERDSIRAMMAPYTKKIADTERNFRETHLDSYLSMGILSKDMGRMSYADLKAAFDKFSDRVKQYGEGAGRIRAELASLENVQPGKFAPDFTATDINGKQFTMSSLRGKVVIIDFWASWCVPCRKSNPHMKELYAKYHDKGLDMVYVSDDDSDPNKWHAAVKKDGLVGDGFHHVLRGLKWDRSKGIAGMDKTNDISNKYAIHYLPTKYLIDKEGKIVCKIDEGEDAKIDEHITQLLK